MGELKWYYFASEECRQRGFSTHLPRGKTSRTVKHLHVDHDIKASNTKTELKRKRSREEAAKHNHRTQMYRVNRDRLLVLLATVNIVNKTLPFQSEEH